MKALFIALALFVGDGELIPLQQYLYNIDETGAPVGFKETSYISTRCAGMYLLLQGILQNTGDERAGKEMENQAYIFFNKSISLYEQLDPTGDSSNSASAAVSDFMYKYKKYLSQEIAQSNRSASAMVGMVKEDHGICQALINK